MSIIDNLKVQNYNTFMARRKSSESKTLKLWMNYLVKPVLLMMTYARAEKVKSWLLFVHCVKTMMPYFFAVGHQSYARLGLVYLRSTENFPKSSVRFLLYFQKGKHVMQHMCQVRIF